MNSGEKQCQITELNGNEQLVIHRCTFLQEIDIMWVQVPSSTLINVGSQISVDAVNRGASSKLTLLVGLLIAFKYFGLRIVLS